MANSVTLRLGVTGAAEVEAAVQKIGHTTKRHFDDAAQSVGLARHEMINLGRQAQDIAVSLAGGMSPMMVLMQQGTQVFDILSSSRGGVGSALKSLGETLVGMVTPARLVTAGLVSGFAAVEYQISKASSALIELGRAQNATGMDPSRILAAQTAGAGAGLDRAGVLGALENANKQFEQFKNNSGSVKEALEKIDSGLVLLADRAQNTGQFIDFLQAKIRELPRPEALDLTQKLFGEDAGTKLFEAIRSGQLAMDALDEAARKTGVTFADGPAKAALDFQRSIDVAAEIADQKLFTAFGRLASPVQTLSMLWQDIKGFIADSALAAERLYEAIKNGGRIAPVPGASGESLSDYEARLGLNGPALPQWGPAVSTAGLPSNWSATRSAFMRMGPEIGPPEARLKREARSSAGGKSDAEREQETFEKISKELAQQKLLASAIGDEHKRIEDQIERENWVAKLGTKPREEHKKYVSETVDQLIRLRHEQDRLNESVKAFNEAYGSVAQTLSGGIKDILKGGKPGEVLNRSLDAFSGNMLDAALTGSGPLAKMLGIAGKDGAVGGLFGSLAGMLGIGPDGAKTQQMTVTAANVIVNGEGAIGGLGSLFGGGRGGGGLFGNIVGGIGSLLGLGGPTPVVGGAGGLAVPTFAMGGVMTSAGPLPLRAYAGGGVATSPQLALFGEGSRPEAFVPLPDGRSIPVSMNGDGQAPRISVHNYAGVEVEPRVSRGEIQLMIREETRKNNARLPGMLESYKKAQP